MAVSGAAETDAELHFVEYVNRTASYSVGATIIIDAVFNRPFTATGSVLQIELGAGRVVSATLDTETDGEHVLKYNYTITGSDDTSYLAPKSIIGTLKKTPRTGLVIGSGNLR